MEAATAKKVTAKKPKAEKPKAEKPKGPTVKVEKQEVSYTSTVIEASEPNLAPEHAGRGMTKFRAETASEADCIELLPGYRYSGPGHSVRKLAKSGKLIKVTAPCGTSRVYTLSLLKALGRAIDKL